MNPFIRLLGVFIFFFFALPATADPTVKFSQSADQDIIVTFYNRQVSGDQITGTLQIQNITGTWVWIEQEQVPGSVSLPETIYLLGPDSTKIIPNVVFNPSSALLLRTTTPIGADYLSLDSQTICLFFALTADFATRGLLSFELPPETFDQPLFGLLDSVVPIIESVMDTDEIGALAHAVHDKDVLGASEAVLDIVNKKEFREKMLELINKNPRLKEAITDDQLENALSRAGFLLEFLNLGEKLAMITDLTYRTFDAPPQGWARIDAATTTFRPTLVSVEPSQIKTLALPGTQKITVRGIHFTANTTLTFSFGNAVYASRPERLHFVSDTQIEYNIAVGSAAGTWTISSPEGVGAVPLAVVNDSAISFNITATAGPNGTVYPPAVTKASGDSQTFAATPAPGFAVNSWYVDGVATPASGNAYTVFNLTRSRSVFVNFKPISATTDQSYLTVQISPPEAALAGAQWKIDTGAFHNAGETVSSLPIGSHTLSFKDVPGFTKPIDRTITILSGANNEPGIYTSIAQPAYTFTLVQPANGTISAQPLGINNGNTYAKGTVVQLYGAPAFTYHLDSWGGDASASGKQNPCNITMDGNKTVTATFAPGDPTLGTFRVVIDPPEAAAAGIKWTLPGQPELRESGTTYTTYPSIYVLGIHGVDGWIGPTEAPVSVLAGVTKDVVVPFTRDTTPGLVTVPLSPPEVISSGAKWHVNGGTYGNGVTVSLPAGQYNVTFDAIAGWTAPSSQPITLARGESKVVPGNYIPASGQPLIAGVSPLTSRLEGGILLTISGANFTAPAAVTIGGHPATDVQVLSSTKLSCIVPTGSAFGSVPVVVTTDAGTATLPNNFSYAVSRGENLSLVSVVGGACVGVAIKNNFAFVGEGRTMLVLDISNPSNPTKVGQIALPGLVFDIAFFAQYACIADGEGGLQIVDITNPIIPRIIGQYGAEGSNNMTSIKVFGGLAYITDYNAGFFVLDLQNAASPRLVSLTPPQSLGRPAAVALKTSALGSFAYVTSDTAIHVVDVTDPAAPVLRGQVGLSGDSGWSLSISGNYVYVASYGLNHLDIIDVSNPDSPINLGGPTLPGAIVVSASADKVFVASTFDSFGFSSWAINGNTLSSLGKITGAFVNFSGAKMAISGTKAFVATGRGGLKIIDISDSRNPVVSGTFNDSQNFGVSWSIAVTGNTLFRNDTERLTAADVTDPVNPGLIATLSEPGFSFGTRSVVANNGLVCEGSSSGIKIIDAAGAPHEVAALPLSVSRSYALVLKGSMLYSMGFNDNNVARFCTIDLTTPSSPQVRGTIDFTSYPSYFNQDFLSVANGRAAVAIGKSDECRVVIFDISNADAPVELGALTFSARAKGIEISSDGSVAYLIDANAPSFVHVLNIADPSNISVIRDISLNSNSRAISRRDNELFVSDDNQLLVYDLQDPSNPQKTRSYTIANAVDICAPTDSENQKQMVYVATVSAGVVGLKELDLKQPEVFVTNPFSPVTTTTTGTASMGGGAVDNVEVTKLTWSNDRGGGGQIDPPFDNWFVAGILLQPGENIVMVSAFDAAGNYGTATRTVTYNAPKQDQSITFSGIPNHVYGDPAFRVTAAASSGLNVSFDISGPASLSDGNLLTIQGTGIVIVHAIQAGNDTFNTATPVEKAFLISKRDQSITFDAIADRSVLNSPVTLNASASSGLPVEFWIEAGPASISGNMLTIGAAGLITVRAIQFGDDNYKGASDVLWTFEAVKVPQTILFGELSDQTVGDAPFTIAATSTAGLDVQFAIAGPALLSGNLVTITGPGVVTLLASQPGNGIYSAAAPVSRTFTVNPPPKQDQTLTFAELPPQVYGVAPLQLSATASSGLEVKLAVVSGPATLDAANLLTITGAGTVTIRADQSGNEIFNAALPMERAFVVAKRDQAINFPSPGDRSALDAPFALVASGNSGLKVLFSLQGGPATLTQDVLTITGAGTVTIKASQAGNDNFNAAQDVVRSFEVRKVAQTISFAEVANQVFGGTPIQLSPTSSSGLAVKLAVISGSATLDGSNLLTLTGAGNVTVRAEQGGNDFYETAVPVQRTIVVAKREQTITFSALADRSALDLPFPIAATADSGLNVVLTIESGPASLAQDVLTISGAGTVVIKASQPGNENFNAAADVTQSFTVRKVSQTITFAPISAQVIGGSPFQLSATASSGLPVNVTVLNGPATVDASHLLTITGAGTVMVRAEQSGNEFYEAAASVERTFNVAKREQTIAFAALADRSAVESPFSLVASAGSGLKVSFSIESGPATINGDVLTMTGGGTIKVRASQAGNENFKAAIDVTQTFTALKASQTITFGELGDRMIGDAPFTLSATATSGLKVELVITGPATVADETVTITGTGTISVVASQAGNAFYEAATSVTRTFNVNPIRVSKIDVSNGKVVLEWPARTGFRYRIHYADALEGPWQLGEEVSAASDSASVRDDTPGATARYYFIELVTP